MDYVVVTGAPPYDGRYEFSLELAGLTGVEWGFIKRLAHYLPLTIMDGYRGGDPELFNLFACFAMCRASAITEAEIPDVFQRLQRLPFDDTVALETEDAAEDDDAADPPTQENSSSNGGSSVDGSRTSSETSADDLNPTGTLASDTSVSDPVTSAA